MNSEHPTCKTCRYWAPATGSSYVAPCTYVDDPGRMFVIGTVANKYGDHPPYDTELITNQFHYCREHAVSTQPEKQE